jgi:5-(carboxyamino)imidazole ribonucleotide mutase
MKASLVFGSQSDKLVYEPLLENLSKVLTVDFKVLSAHRNPQELKDYMDNIDSDVFIGGAGLAAHLPGVMASLTDRPVFGIPVGAHLGGLDAYFSILQMPFGVPVLCCGEGNSQEVVNFLSSIKELRDQNRPLKKMALVVKENLLNYEYARIEIERSQKFATEQGIDLAVLHAWDDEHTCIQLVSSSSEVRKEQFGLHVPLLDNAVKADPSFSLTLFDWGKEGGLWTGVNNTRNAIKILQKFIQK